MPIRTVSIAAPSLGGGGMVRVHFLAELVRHMGLGVEIVVHRPSGRPIYPTTPDGLSLHTVSGGRIWRYGPRYVERLTGDAVIAVKPLTSSLGLALLARRQTARPVILDLDDWELSPGAGGLVSRTKRRMMERLVRRADALTVNNLTLQRRYGGTLLPSGRDARLFDPSRTDPEASRRSLGLEGRFVLMFPGTVVPHSGIEALLTAVDRLARPELVLVIVGGRASGARYVVERLRRWRKRILMLPEVPRERLPGTLAAGHVVVVPHRDMPSARHNLPMKLLDGMAMAKPVLATRVGDIPLVLGENSGYLVRPDSAEQLAEALGAIMADPVAAAARGRLARRRFEDHYSLDAIAPTMQRILDPFG